MKRVATLAFLAIVLSACSEPLEFADWTIPVAEGTRVIEYDDPAMEGRDDRVELVEDLVVGARGEDPNYLFFQPAGVAVDSAGRMYVVDRGDNQVKVFDADGEFLSTIGREGQGPGELQMPVGLAIAGERVIVNDWGNRRLSSWDLDGAHLGDAPMSGRLEPTIFGTEAGSIMGAMRRRLDDRSRVIDVGSFSIEGAENDRHTTLPDPENFELMGDGGGISMSRMAGGPSFVATPSGEMYATAGEEYQILAFDRSGAPLWALRAARLRPAFGEEHKNAFLDPIRERFPDLAALPVEWPEFTHTVGRLAVDGHGHLYVFPFAFRDLGPEEPPVEVYSQEGERLFAGTMRDARWAAASGDFVYSLRRNEQTEEQELVRYRLVEPFE